MSLGPGLDEVDWARAIVGLVVFLGPGFAWTWALLRDLGWSRLIPVAVILSFTIQPFVLLALNLLLGVPITMSTGTYLAVASALLGVAVGTRDSFQRLLPWRPA